MSYEISSDVPLPITLRRTRWPWASMKVGDSFLVQDIGDRGSIASAASYYGKRHPGFKVTIRKVEGGLRVWRIE